MRLVLWVAALGILGLAVASGHGSAGRHAVIIVGSTDGYLSPCGCTKPMAGGIRRRITAIRALSLPGETTVLDNGGLVAGNGRQDEMKAETLAEVMRLVKVAAINYGVEEARLGTGMSGAIDRLSGGALLSTGFAGSASLSAARFKVSGPLLIGGIDPRREAAAALVGTPAQKVDDSVSELVAEAELAGLVPVLMTRGDLDHAKAIAKDHPKLRLIICSIKSAPLDKPMRVGRTLIVTPGEHGKHVVRIDWDGNQFVDYQSVSLGPEYRDDPDAARLYSSYLARVGEEDLLSMTPREPTAKFAGSKACYACHPREGKVWRDSRHGDALATLEHDGHGRDPDCVACHVVGLRSIVGFKSRKATPLLADVGCESCHGPGRAHVMAPAKNRMPVAGEKSCATCHVPEHSPGFTFEEYWPKISH